MKKIQLLLLAFLLCLPVLAQKKEISQARTYIKSRKNYDKAEQLMQTLLKDSANRQNLKVHVTLAEALRGQYEQSNEKLYLRQKVDSAATFSLLLRMFRAYELLDSLDATPDDKGNVRIRYRERSASYLSRYRKNLFNGGAFFMHKAKFEEAHQFLNHYLQTGQMPIFSSFHFAPDSVAAYWTLFCGYQLRDPARTLPYVTLAKRDSVHLENTLQYLAETYMLMNDTAKYVATLHEGFLSFRRSEYFFTHLVDYYAQQKQYHSALDIVDAALKSSPDSQLFLFARSNLLLNLGQYDDCIAVCDTLIARNDSLADAYYNAGAAWLNKALEMERQGVTSAKQRHQQQACYASAQPYMERYRLLCPEDKDRWATALYHIYLRLNLGRQFEEIDRLLRE